MLKKILTFFILGFILFFIFNCSKSPTIAPANPSIPYPKIIYAKELDTSIIPTDFPKTFENRFKILFNQNPNPNIQEIRYYFTHFYNESQGDYSPRSSFSMLPRYLLELNIQVLTHNTDKLYKQYYEIPIALFNPMYDQHFDFLIQKALQTQ